MEKGNVLVIGNSGVGKSTLINAVMGSDVAVTNWGKAGTTKVVEKYEGEGVPFNLIDTIGFEPNFFKEHQAIKEIKKWSKKSAKDDDANNQINAIWFCVDGCAAKLFEKTIKDLLHATKMWKSIPVIVVITKSFSKLDQNKNIEMVNEVFAKQKNASSNLKKVIPVVAQPFYITETEFAAPEGITELIDLTNELMPEGFRAAEKDIYTFKLKRKKALAQTIVGGSTVAGTAVGAVPIPIPDSSVLVPLEMAEITALAKFYHIDDKDNSKGIMDAIIGAGAASLAAKTVLNGLKAIPGATVPASVLNGIVAGAFVAAIGEASVYVFEKIYTGEKSAEDIEWVRKIIDSKLSSEFVDTVAKVAQKIKNDSSAKEIAEVLIDAFMGGKK